MKAMLPCAPRSIRIGTVPEPVPAEHEVLVAVEAYSVNRGETFLGTLQPWEHTAQIIDDIRNRRVRGNAVLEVTP